MVDNIDVTPGTGRTVAADDIGGVLFQRVKLGIGADGAAVDLAYGQGAKAASFSVTIASDDDLQTKLGALTEAGPATDSASSGLNGRLQRVAGRLTTLIGRVSARSGTPFKLPSAAAGTNATVVKASASTLRKVLGSSTRASACYLKLYDKATIPVVGTDVPFLTIPIPGNSTFDLNFEQDFLAGMGMAITVAPADSDATAIAAGEIISLNILLT
jgi:hypothetical protein